MLLSVLHIGHSSNFFILLHFSHIHICPQLQNITLGSLSKHIIHSSCLKVFSPFVISTSSISGIVILSHIIMSFNPPL